MTDLIAFDDQAAWHAALPRSITRLAVTGLVLMAVAFGGFGLWAFTAPLAAAVIAQGSLVATGRNKIVQHLEGGIISHIYVEEGQAVKIGDPLIGLDRTAAEATERELYLRELRLQATAARLMAEYNEAPQLVFPARVRDAAVTDTEIASIVDGQRLNYTVSRKALMNDVALLQRNIDALTIRESGYAEQLAAMRRRSEILDEDISDKTQLFDRGLVRKSELSALQRMQAEAEGQLARLQAELDEMRQMNLKYHDQIANARATYRQAALNELSPIQADLESVREKGRQARSVLERSAIRAPVSGTVVRMHYYTPGGVIETGKPIAEILPTGAPLIIETQIPRSERDSVAAGQRATVRLTGLNQRTTPVLEGQVFYISADAVRDDEAFDTTEVYIVRVSLPASELARVKGFVPAPGMPTEVMIQTEARTFAAYIWKPIKDSMSRSFREQ